MVTERRKNYVHAAVVEAAIRFAVDGRLARAPVLLRAEGIGLAVQTRVLSPLGERRRPQDASANYFYRDASGFRLGSAVSDH